MFYLVANNDSWYIDGVGLWGCTDLKEVVEVITFLITEKGDIKNIGSYFTLFNELREFVHFDDVFSLVQTLNIKEEL